MTGIVSYVAYEVVISERYFSYMVNIRDMHVEVYVSNICILVFVMVYMYLCMRGSIDGCADNDRLFLCEEFFALGI